MLKKFRRPATYLSSANARRQAAAKHRAIDQPIRLRIAADHGGRQESHHASKGNLCLDMATTASRLRGDNCERDWIWEREVEAAPWEETRRLSVAAWERQYRRIRESSAFYARKFREAGIGNSFVSLSALSNLPFTTKARLRPAPHQGLT